MAESDIKSRWCNSVILLQELCADKPICGNLLSIYMQIIKVRACRCYFMAKQTTLNCFQLYLYCKSPAHIDECPNAY